jgi:DNA-binding MarR family transcriptional regulator
MANLAAGEPTTDETVPAVAMRRLFTLMKGLEEFSKHVQGRYGITGPQLFALWELRLHGDMGTSALARRMYVDPSTATGVADRLEAKGLVTRHRDLADHRRVRLSVTPDGLALTDRAPRAVSSRFTEVLERMPGEQAEVLAAGLAALTAAIADDRQGGIDQAQS